MKTMTTPHYNQDAIVTNRLKKLEKIATPVFFAIPLCLWLAGGKTLALWTLCIWPLYCVTYLVAFHRIFRHYSSPELRKVAVMSNQHVFYQMSWLILVLISLLCIFLIFQAIE
jgi:hypothetical protein